MKKIAIIGTGIMGRGMAANFLKAGFEVFVWNRTQTKLDNLAKQGAKITSTAKAATKAADIVFEVTANDESSRSVWLADDGILAGANSEKILILNGTLSAEWTDELAAICQKQNRIFFDMPLTGGRSGAENGKLHLLCGGDEKTLEEIKPILQAISEKIWYFGPAGSGTRFKLLLQMVQGIHLAVFAEAMKVAETKKMNISVVGQALAERLGGTTAMGWRDYNRDPADVSFAVQWILKDLKYAKTLAGELETPQLDDAIKKFQQASDKGLSDQDWTTILKN